LDAEVPGKVGGLLRQAGGEAVLRHGRGMQLVNEDAGLAVGAVQQGHGLLQLV